MDANTPLQDRIAEIAPSLTSSEAQVAAFIANNWAMAAVSSTAELGTYTATSDATVVRTAKKLGYANFRELRRAALAISTRHRDPSKILGDALGQISDSRLGIHKVLRDTAEVLNHFEANLDVETWNQAVDAMSRAARVITYGIGPSGCPADYLSVSLRRIGVRSTNIHASGLALADHLLDIATGDLLVLFATKRRFREIDIIVDHAAEAGATTILITEALGVALQNRVDIVLTTPTTTAGTSDGVLMGMIVARALHLSLASRDQSSAVQTMERLNALRAKVVGGKLDAEG